jgi:hypothetical protein
MSARRASDAEPWHKRYRVRGIAALALLVAVVALLIWANVVS